jgi:N-acyl-D-amino-acid deacylase
MRFPGVALTLFLVATAGVSDLIADDSGPAPDVARDAITRAIPLLEKASAGSAAQRVCFTCHNQAVPVFALVEAKKRGFDVDFENLETQLQHTANHLARGREEYLQGNGQGGQVLTAGYALWTLEAGGRSRDDVTTAVTTYLLKHQADESHWTHRGRRPPSSGSDFTATYTALRALAVFGTDEQQTAIADRVGTVSKWLLSEPTVDTEDRVFRLLSLKYANAGEDEVQKAVDELIAAQLDDGGWAQKDDMGSDAYATATVLYALLQASDVGPDSPVVRRGVQYLTDSQCDDGSWHVVTRAEPFQTYFESGFPHGADQFISTAASGWATYVLLLTLPEPVEQSAEAPAGE